LALRGRMRQKRETHVEPPLEKEAIMHDLSKEMSDTQKNLNWSTEGQSGEAVPPTIAAFQAHRPEDNFKEAGPSQVSNNPVIIKFNAGSALCQNTKPPSQRRSV
ncbi:hypothetical protein PanWU01x14_370450, partial [Parasponia andersonii]